MGNRIHLVTYQRTHRFPRWSWFQCSKCARLFEVHDSEALDFHAPKADCTGVKRG